MIELTLRKRLRDFALDVSLSVRTEQRMALMGPTGCGKTTILNMIAGIQRPDEGRIVVGDRVLLDTAAGTCLTPQQRRVGFVCQDYALFPHLSVLSNVMYGARARRKSRADAEAVAREALHRVRLAPELAAVAPQKLSGGQQQRVALARALASDAQVLLLDEPMSALDRATRRDLRAELRELLVGLGVPTVIVTHDAADALALCEVVCLVQAGRVLQQGSRDELLAEPCDPLVADFLGLDVLAPA